MATEENTTTEEWRAVVGYEGFYEVSDLGRVRSLDRIKRNGKRARGKILRTPLSEGYPCCNLVRGGKQILNRVHRLVAAAFVEKPSDEASTVNHKDFDRTNNRPDNLEWLSHGDNMRHAHAANRCAGRRVYTRGKDYRRLEADTVREIRRRYASGETARSLCAAFDLSHPHVYRIVNRVVWKKL